MFAEERRLHALHLCDEWYSVDEVDIISGRPTHLIDRWRRTLAATSSVRHDQDTKNSHADAALRNDELVRAVKLLVEAERVAFLRDHVDHLVTLSTYDPDVDSRYVSSATVYHFMRHLGYTRKSVERLFLEPSEHEQREFAIMIMQLPLRCLVSFEETHTDGGEAYRKLGRTLRGNRCDLIDKNPRTVPRKQRHNDVRLLDPRGGVVTDRRPPHPRTPPLPIPNARRGFVCGAQEARARPHLRQSEVPRQAHAANGSSRGVPDCEEDFRTLPADGRPGGRVALSSVPMRAGHWVCSRPPECDA